MILFSTEVPAVLVAKLLVILDILFLTSFILALTIVLVANLIISDNLSSISLILALYRSCLRTSFFTALLSLLKSIEVVSNFPMSNLSTLLFKLFKPLGTLFKLSMCNLSTSDFKLVKLVFLAKTIHSFMLYLFISVQRLRELVYPLHLTYSLSLFLLINFPILNSF